MEVKQQEMNPQLLRQMAHREEKYFIKPSWSGDALRAIGNLPADQIILRYIFEEACMPAIMEGIQDNLTSSCVSPHNVHTAASIIQRRQDRLKRIIANGGVR